MKRKMINMHGNHYRIAAILLLLGSILLVQSWLDSGAEAYVRYYDAVFLPYQRLRNRLLNDLPFSFGDVVYVLLFLFLLLLLIRLVYYGFTYRRNKTDFWTELLRLMTFPLVLYLGFLLSWGGNYYRPGLTAPWKVKKRVLAPEELLRLNYFLVERLNQLSLLPFSFSGLDELNAEAGGIYRERYGRQLPEFQVKPSAFGYLLGYAGVHGYYNPFTGESQFNHSMPLFMHPFVGLHEMAHQAGIAAEDDANLMAYLATKQSANPAFRYSGYFNVFLYAFADLRYRDSAAADDVWALLNVRSRDDYDTLRSMHARYKSIFRGFSSTLYNRYLRLHGQKKGLRSYNTVTLWVYLLELEDYPEPGWSGGSGEAG